VKISLQTTPGDLIGEKNRLSEEELIQQISKLKPTIMLKKTLMFLSVVGVLWGCNGKKETAQLQTTVDSLRLVLVDRDKTVTTLQEIESLIDSIDLNRNVLRVRMSDGTSVADYRTRMKDINQYVKETQTRIAYLENKLSASKNSSSSFTGTVKKLRHDLEVRNQELIALQQQVDRYHNQTENLIQTVGLQKAELTDKLAQLDLKQQEVVKLEANIKDLITQSKVDEADYYFARAQGLEEAANRTKFAPRKKRNTRKEALELYKLAASHGKEEAQSRIAELEKKI
jgi:chromosome segregation ATPase